MPVVSLTVYIKIFLLSAFDLLFFINLCYFFMIILVLVFPVISYDMFLFSLNFCVVSE
jgi:hypothetical protein